MSTMAVVKMVALSFGVTKPRIGPKRSRDGIVSVDVRHDRSAIVLNLGPESIVPAILVYVVL